MALTFRRPAVCCRFCLVWCFRLLRITPLAPNTDTVTITGCVKRTISIQDQYEKLVNEGAKFKVFPLKMRIITF